MIPKGSDWKFVIEGIIFALFLWPLIAAQLSRFTNGRKAVAKNV